MIHTSTRKRVGPSNHRNEFSHGYRPTRLRFVLVFLCLINNESIAQDNWDSAQIIRADVVIAGGSTAALAAAFAAAEEGAHTVLIEPTDWIGGQLTASGVPAVDEAWHKIRNDQGDVVLDVASIARNPANMTPSFRTMIEEMGNPGRGWVSRFCFEPKLLLERHLLPLEHRLKDHLTIYRNAVVKNVVRKGRSIVAVHVIQRTPASHLKEGGYDILPSEDLKDWYSPNPSERFTKALLRFESNDHGCFVDATEWGELLALAHVDYLQGLDSHGKPIKGMDTVGQATVFGFVQQLHEKASVDWAPHKTAPNLGWGKYEGKERVWDKVWTYRRIRSRTASIQPGDLCLQNWGYSLDAGNGGNDYPSDYLFLSKKETAECASDWQGGVNLVAIAGAEERAYAWHQWFKSQAPDRFLTLETEVLGTAHGLAKLPYVRDTRRSIGLGNFVLQIDDLIGADEDQTGKVFEDTIAIGAYPADVHHLAGKKYPPEFREHIDTRPFCIPFRALTHYQLDNFLVAGKTMAEGFMANSATRLHPIEWSTGTAAGVIAAHMQRHRQLVSDAYENIGTIQTKVAKYTPVQWTLPE